MTQHPFPGPGHDGDEPAPGDPARDWADEDDRYLAWLTVEVDAGRIEVPPDEPPSAVTVSLGEADHTVPYPAGKTDECGLSPRCNR